MSDTKHTTVEHGTTFDGSINSKNPVTVGGTVKGRVKAPELNVTQDGAVDGNVRVSKLTSAGQVSGTIDADKVELTGRVNDGTVIQARSIEVPMNAEAPTVMFGNCELNVGQAKRDGKTKADQGPAKQKKGEPVL